MKLKITSNNKKVTLDQAFIFNGIRVHITLADGEGFADVFGENVDREYLERAILAPLNIEVLEEADDTVDTKKKEEPVADTVKQEPEQDTESMPEQKKVVSKEAKTTKESSTSTKKKTTRRKKKTTSSKSKK